jgi:hypothetical protein
MRLQSALKLLWTAALSATLLACSSTYVLTDKTKSTLATLDRTRALAIVKRNIPATPRQGGFIRDEFVDGILTHSSGNIYRASVSMMDTRIQYTGTVEVAGGGSNTPIVKTPNTVVVSFRDTPVPRSADLTKLLHVWIASGNNSSYVVTLVVERSGLHNYWLLFNLAPENLDEFLAAIKYLSPAADIVSHL